MKALRYGLAMFGCVGLSILIVEDVCAQAKPPSKSKPPIEAGDRPRGQSPFHRGSPRDEKTSRDAAETTVYVRFGKEFAHTAPGQTGSTTAKSANFGPVAFHTGQCRTQDVVVTIRTDGRVFYSATVFATDTGSKYGTVLRFFDRNNLELYTFDRFWSAYLGKDHVVLSREDLAIPQHLYPHITKVARDDYCDD